MADIVSIQYIREKKPQAVGIQYRRKLRISSEIETLAACGARLARHQ